MGLDELVSIQLSGLKRGLPPSMSPVAKVAHKDSFPALDGHTPTVRARRVVVNSADIQHGQARDELGRYDRKCIPISRIGR